MDLNDLTELCLKREKLKKLINNIKENGSSWLSNNQRDYLIYFINQEIETLESIIKARLND